jgi:hypothetical protein
MGAEDDKIDLLLLGVFDDLGGRVSDQNLLDEKRAPLEVLGADLFHHLLRTGRDLLLDFIQRGMGDMKAGQIFQVPDDVEQVNLTVEGL